MDYFIVRIYRHQKNNSGILVGVVEEMNKSEKKAFTNYDELWKILNYGIGSRHKKETKKRRQQRTAGRESCKGSGISNGGAR